ncbi:hypothetical protein PHMEG_00023145 [Phytophthora megakarya]|uniref:Uncharacterized protein n=1 Tax=Phytophthora megakarya TaxID=4795 RepID=A0A225VGY0_9STRA|nr:hypothetical protein PHMEG_00023145 [Phytophthora megakarya]
MALLWSIMQVVSWLALQVLALALHLAPAAAVLSTVTAIVLVSAMTAQALEHGMLVSMHRSKWRKHSQYSDLRRDFYRGYWLLSKWRKHSEYSDLRRDFYRGYWLLTLLYLISSMLWIYFTERTEKRFVYGAIFCAMWWGVQLALVVALTPLDEVRTKLKTIKW